MTTVNVTTNKNTVKVSEENAPIVVVKTAGPQGPEGPQGPPAPTNDGLY